jgi:DNA polymerase-3 subunit gamma/tau|tara:strand:+ start:15867 stop:16787 length:921 start_codon:yes stop_codon:yes gene_type:complete
MALHLKYRPTKLEDVVGNKSTVKSLESILERDMEEIPHAFLFHGASGCGKTTFARIVTNILGCDPQDFLEINTGSNRGIDTARSILQNIHYKPLGGKVKVILLDEVHATTKDFQNALLKALEDTPKHVYFILCTTDPKKLLPTVRNRCTMFEVHKLTETLLIKLLTEVTIDEDKAEGIDAEIIAMIANKADGCPRQSLVLLDQVIDLKPKDRKRAIQAFKTEEEKTIDLCRLLLDKRSKWDKVAKVIKGIEDDPESVRWAILGYMCTVLLSKENTQASIAISMFEEPFFNSGRAGLTLACLKCLEK